MVKQIKMALVAGDKEVAARLIAATERGGAQPKRGEKAREWATLRKEAGL